MTNPTYFTVVADYKAVVIDDAIDVDADPQNVPISATVTFRPVLRDGDAMLATNASPRPTGFLAAPIIAKLNTSGRLVLRDVPDGTRQNAANFAALPEPGDISKYYVALDTGSHYRWDGSQYLEILPYQPVRLLADTPLLELNSPLFYTVTFSNVIYGGRVYKLNGFTFQAPNSDIPGGLNLIEVMRQPGQPPSGITKIAPGAVRNEDGNLVFSFGGVDIPDPIPVDNISYTINSETITDSTFVGRDLLTAGSATAARTVINAASVNDVPQQIADEDIPGQVAAAVAADETVAAAAAAAAEAAVDADIAGRDLLENGDPGVPYVGEIEGDWIAAHMGPLGEFLFGVTEDGAAEFTALSVGDDAVTTTVEAEDVLWAPVVFDDDTYSEIHVDKDGRVQQWALKAWAARMNLSDLNTEPDTVHILIGLGQSNMSGRGLPISAEIDPPNPRIYQYGANGSEITEATVPLDMVDTAYGVSPLTLIAREYLQRLPDGDVILLIPAARGGSTLGAANTESASGVWNAAYTGASVDLYDLAKTQIDAALDAAADQWPNAAVRIAGTFWHQGEGNPNISEADYASRLDAIVSDLRTHLSEANMPFVVGGLVPEWVAVESPKLDGVVAAHTNTPNRLVRTGYAIPPPNSGGNINLDPTDRVHFHRAGLEELSSRMLTAWDRALRNTTTSVPHPPADVSATVNGTTLTVHWSQPMCRYTGFTVEYSLNGGAWTAITHTTVATTATATIASTLPVQVRVSTTNNVGTSPTSTPVYAVIIKEP